MDEKQLLQELKLGNEKAFTQLYQKYWRQVYNFSRLYLRTIDAAEEVVQDVFVKLWESRKSIRDEDNFKGLLFIMTRNLIFNSSRKHLNEEAYKMSILSAMEESYDIDAEIDAADLQMFIDRLISELPPQRQTIFNLSRKEHKSYKEIAAELNLSEKTVEHQISAALKFLKKNVLMLTFFV